MYKNRQVTVIIPALNEESSIALVVNALFELRVCSKCSNIITNSRENRSVKSIAAHDVLTKESRNNTASSLHCTGHSTGQCDDSSSVLVDQIVVGDNGSTDNTATIAKACGATVVSEPERGYGAACLAALAAPASSELPRDLVVFVDADNSVATHELPSLLKPLIEGADLVIGSRTLGHCEKGALSPPQAIGNKLASALLGLLWSGKVTDLGPFRAVTDQALTAMKMSDRKFGWTVEMQIRALQLSLRTVEIPVSTHKRIGKSKISGTVRGVLGAAHGILGTIAKLYWRQIFRSDKTARTTDTIPQVAPVDDTRKST